MMLRASGFFRVIAYLSLPFALPAKKARPRPFTLARSPDVRSESGNYFTSCKPAAVSNTLITQQNRSFEFSMKSLEQRMASSPVGPVSRFSPKTVSAAGS
jgi:hypothetical protein